MATITICGLGPGGTGRLTEETATLLAEHDRVFLRTAVHPGIENLVAGDQGRVHAFDYLYEEASSFEEVYRTITHEVVQAAHRDDHVVYAVPGSPLVLERSVRHMRASDGVDGLTVELMPAVSFLDEIWAALKIDPVDDGVRMVDGLQFATDAADQRGPLVVAHAHAQWVLSDIKLALDAGPEQKVIALQRLGTDDERIFEVEWPDLDRVVEADHLTTLYIPQLVAPVGYQLARSVEMMRRLRRDCPWDQTQTHQSLRKYLIEEAYEVLDAIDDLDPDPGLDSDQDLDRAADTGDGSDVDIDRFADLEEELGDLWFQILFHCELASEAGQFTLAEVAQGLTDKMISRHPHVYGDTGAQPPLDGSTVAGWEQLKRQEKGRGSVLDGIPRSLPALSLADKTLKKADGTGSQADLGPIQDQIVQLLSPNGDSADGDSAEGDGSDIGNEDAVLRVGEVLLAMVEVARRMGIDSELALRQSVDQAQQRFRAIEAEGRTDGLWVRG